MQHNKRSTVPTSFGHHLVIALEKLEVPVHLTARSDVSRMNSQHAAVIIAETNLWIICTHTIHWHNC